MLLGTRQAEGRVPVGEPMQDGRSLDDEWVAYATGTEVSAIVVDTDRRL